MSQHDVQLVREAFLAASHGDPVAARAMFDDSIEWDMSGVIGWAEKETYRGPEVIEFLRTWARSWREWRFDVDEVCDGAGDNVFVAIHEWGVGVDSEARVDQRRYFVIVLKRGRMMRARMFSDRQEASEAAGLTV